MKVVIDPEMCQGHLRCYTKVPELFGVDEQGHGVAPEGPLDSESSITAARLAVAACPEGAIRLEE